MPRPISTPHGRELPVLQERPLSRCEIQKQVAKLREHPELHLANQPEDLKESYDYVIVGSGYGGSVWADEMAKRGYGVAVLERGKYYKPGDYPETTLDVLKSAVTPLTPSGLLRMDGYFDPRSNGAIFSGQAVGGSSVINGNVFDLAAEEVYSPENGFPEGIYPKLRREYLKLAFKLGAAPWEGPVPAKAAALYETAVRENELNPANGSDAFQIKAITVQQHEGLNGVGVHQEGCTGCGNCLPGCNVGAKGSLDRNLLQEAKRFGAEIYPQAQVTTAHKHGDHDYTVYFYQRHGPLDLLKKRRQIRARNVVIAGGAVGSTLVLENIRKDNRANMAIPEQGRFYAQADRLGLAVNGDLPNTPFGVAHPVVGQPEGPGPLIISDVFRKGWDGVRNNNVEESSIPGAFVGPYTWAARAVSMAEAIFKWKSLPRMRSALDAEHHSQVFLTIGAEKSFGKLEPNWMGGVRVKWPSWSRDPGVASAEGYTEDLAGAVNSDLYEASKLGGGALTVHPLGPWTMGVAVDQTGELFDPDKGPGAVHAGFYVSDASIVPASVGYNPSATIASLSAVLAKEAHARNVAAGLAPERRSGATGISNDSEIPGGTP